MRSYRALMGTKMKHKVKEGLTMRTWHWIEAVEHKAAAAVKNTVSNVEHAASNALDKEGDRVEVLRKDLSGWSYGCLDGHGQREGWFPDWIIREKTNSWVAKYRQDFAELETALQPLESDDKSMTMTNRPEQPTHLPQLPLAEQREEPYDIYVDVFAEATGLLTWDHNFHVDNRLLTPHLFTIKHKEERILQYFNAADWIAGHSHHEQESFDHRFQPSFHCDSAPTDTGRHEMPLGLRRLWRGVMWHNALLERLLRPWKTAQLKQFLLGSRWHFFLEPAGTLTATMNGKFVMTLHAHQGITIRQKKGAFCLVLGPATQVQVPGHQKQKPSGSELFGSELDTKRNPKEPTIRACH
eukprot:g19482.t1